MITTDAVLRVLMVEDCDEDADLAARELRRSGYTLEMSRVEDAEGLRAALDREPWDVVISDHVLPGFGSAEAFEVLRASGSEAPFIVVSGRIGEESVAEALRHGAAEYVNKENLEALPAAVRRCVASARAAREARAAQNRLREAEERFRLAFDNAPIGIALVAPDGRWLRVNQALETITGYPADELLTTTFQNITHPDDVDVDVALMEQLLAGEIPRYSLEKRYLRRDGSTVWIQLSVSLVRDPATGEPLYFISQVQDIDERKRADDRFRGLMDSAPDAMVLVDGRGVITLVNEQVRNLFGYQRDELVGQPVEVLVPESLRGRHPRHRDGFMAQPHSRPMGAGVELYAVSKDGTEIPVEIGLSPLHAEEGDLIIAAVRDVRERKRFETALIEVRVRRRQALEINDNIIQGLTAAALTMDAGMVKESATFLKQTLDSARNLMTGLLESSTGGEIQPGDLVRARPSTQPFTVALPDLAPEGRRDPPRWRILLADDDDDVRTLVRLKIESLGPYSVVGEARDGEQAVQQAADLKPDVVVLDLSMPGADGLQAVPRIRQVSPETRIIVLSGLAEAAVADQALASGAARYVEKGTHMQLATVIAQVLAESGGQGDRG